MGAKRQAKRRDWPPNLYQQPGGYFYFRNPRTKKVKGLGRDKAKAFQQARAANSHLDEVSRSTLVEWITGTERMRLSDWMDKYLELWLAESELAPRTIEHAKQHIARFKQQDIAGYFVSDITTKHIADYLDTIESVTVANSSRAKLHDIFNMAESKGLIETGRNPVSATRRRDYTVKRERLTLDQFMEIKNEVSGPVANGMMLALLTGQRLGDVAAMQFSQYRDGMLFIVQEKTGTKIQQDGNIRLSAVGMSIGEMIKQCRDRYFSKFIVHHTKASGAHRAGDGLNARGMSSAFTAARDKVGIKAQEGSTAPTFHEIRSLAERLYRKEYGSDFAQAIMGHKHAKMTAEYNDMRGSGWSVVEAKSTA